VERLENKVYVISGASSGIGKSCVDMLLNQGMTVVGFDICDSSTRNDRYVHFIVDVADENSVLPAINEIENRYSKIDGLVNCAGTFASAKPFYEITVEEWNKVVSVNLTGTFLLSKYISLIMIKNMMGKIVNISCIRSKVFRPNMADYAASKGGIVSLTSAMALDLSKYNIHVNSIAPGFTYTGMTSKSFDNQEIRQASEQLIPNGRLAMPDDISKVVLFLLSDSSDYINGETIFVDGGYSISK
jgi:NAD(P)-dependent dehydrogenase (short-subunit alcohol dehydrogenase family)